VIAETIPASSRNKGHDVFLEGRDLDFQIDFNSWLVRKGLPNEAATL